MDENQKEKLGILFFNTLVDLHVTEELVIKKQTRCSESVEAMAEADNAVLSRMNERLKEFADILGYDLKETRRAYDAVYQATICNHLDLMEPSDLTWRHEPLNHVCMMPPGGQRVFAHEMWPQEM